MKKELLMPWETYNKTEHPVPYTYVIEKNNQYLFYFGSKHLYDPNHPQFAEIKAMWKSFLEKTQNINTLAMVEGGVRPVLASEEEAIKVGGEMHFVTFLAARNDVPFVSPEPSDRERFKVLLEAGFSKEEIIYHEFARMCYQWNQIQEKPDFEKYLGNHIQSLSQECDWEDFPFTIESMEEIQKKIFGTEFDKYDTQFFYDIINPTTEKSVINKISRWDDDEFRDLYILEQIEKAWKEGKNIFITYGASHAVRHEPVIRDFVEK